MNNLSGLNYAVTESFKKLQKILQKNFKEHASIVEVVQIVGKNSEKIVKKFFFSFLLIFL